ncbi:MAG: hypothetical protein ACRD1R_02800 [Acidobacteriota bacterium]
MTPMLLIFASCFVLVSIALINFFSSVEAERLELNFLLKKNLYAYHVLKIIESPDYLYLSSRNKKFRDHLFVAYSRNLRADIKELAQLPLKGSAYFYYLFFNICYVLLMLKYRLYSRRDDLRALLGIELMMVRKMVEYA